jgi:hypothetical protein
MRAHHCSCRPSLQQIAFAFGDTPCSGTIATMSVSERHRAPLVGCDHAQALESAARVAAAFNLRPGAIDDEGPDHVVAHWDDPDPAVWISFVDPYGHRREDAVVYSVTVIEVEGAWQLELTAVRDHMRKEELIAWFADRLGLRFAP